MMEKDTTEKNTELLQSELKNAKNLSAFFEENAKNLKEKSVPEYLMEMLIKYDVEKSDVVSRAGLSGTYPYQIFDGRKTAGREKLIQLAFGFPLNLEETQRLLKHGGYSELYVKNKREAFIMYALEKGMDIHKLNELLFECGEKTFD